MRILCGLSTLLCLFRTLNWALCSLSRTPLDDLAPQPSPSRRTSTHGSPPSHPAPKKPRPAIPAKEEGPSRLRRMLLSPVVSGVAGRKERGAEE